MIYFNFFFNHTFVDSYQSERHSIGPIYCIGYSKYEIAVNTTYTHLLDSVPRMFSLASSSSTSSSGMPAVYKFITGGRHTDPPTNTSFSLNTWNITC